MLTKIALHKKVKLVIIFRFLISVNVMLLINAGNTSAHPHMFIDWTVEPSIEDSMMAGVRVVWTFDEMNSSAILQQYDLNKNGTLDDNEVDSIRINSLPGLAQYNYFMIVSWGKKALKIRKVDQFRATLTDSRLKYSFLAPCLISLSEFAYDNLTIAFSDPSMFISFDIDSAQQMHMRFENFTITTTKKTVDYLPTIVLKFAKL